MCVCHIYTYIHMHIHTHTYTYVCHMYVCMYIYIAYMYTCRSVQCRRAQASEYMLLENRQLGNETSRVLSSLAVSLNWGGPLKGFL